MEPDKTYPLHSADDNSQSGQPVTSADNQYDSPLDAPSKYGQSNNATPVQPDAVPWYLRPLTKTTKSPLTSAQTRPFVPRQPPPPVQRQSEMPSPSPRLNVSSALDDGQLPQPQFQTVAAAQKPSEPAATASVKAPPLSPFRSPSITPPAPQSSMNMESSQASVLPADRFRMPGRAKPSAYQQALSAATPKPFSQFDTQVTSLPVESAPLKPKKFRKFIGITLAVLLVGGIGMGVYSLWRSNSTRPSPAAPAVVASAEDNLYQAIENHLSTGEIHQVFEQTVTAADTSTFKIEATSDFSDPRMPKSHITYELKSGDGEAAINGSGELTILGQNEYYGKLTKPALFFDGSEYAQPKVGQWYVVAGADTTAELLFDPLSARTSINSSLGEFPVGSFSGGARQQLMRYIRDQNVYKIVSSEQVNLEGKKTTHYTTELDIDAVNELNKRVYAAMGENAEEMPVTFTENGARKTELWVSSDSVQIVKIKISREYKSGSNTVKEVTVVHVSYPNDTSVIRKPEGAITGAWAKAE